MVAIARNVTILALCLGCLGGCAAWNKPATVLPPLTQEEADWWAANQQRKRYVPGKGYYIEGTSGYFDHEGRRVSSELTSALEDDRPGPLERLAPKKLWAGAKKAMGKGPNEQIARKALEEGDQLFREKKFVAAADAYRKAYQRWPDSPLEEEAIFKAAESEFFADRYAKADDEYALLVKKYSSTQYLSQVT